jgi:hypothetical protein
MDEKWMSCKVSEGMFPGEKTVVIENASRPLSFFVSGSESFFNGSTGEIKVGVLWCDRHSAIVSLPKETLEGHRIARINAKCLRDAPMPTVS